MFIKCKPNKSGSVSVQLIESVRKPGSRTPISRLIKSFGSSKDQQEIEDLKALAQKYLDQLKAPQHASPTSLFLQSGHDIDSFKTSIIGFKQVFGSLYDHIFSTQTGLKTKGNNLLRDLVTMRIACPKSKRHTAEISHEFGFNLDLDSIYKLMDRIDTPVIEKIKSLSYANTKRLLHSTGQEINVLFYDLTTLSFETNTQDDLREFGFSKDGKHAHVQIMMALITTESGLPIGYELFKGNTSEGTTLEPALKSLKEKYQISKIVVVADSGLISKNNVQAITSLGLDYIIGGRIKNATGHLKQNALRQEGYSQLTDDLRGKIYTPPPKKDKKTKNTPHLPQDEEQQDTQKPHLKIIYHSQERQRKDKYDREKYLEKLAPILGQGIKKGLSPKYRKSFIQIEGEDSTLNINEEALAIDVQYDGFFMLETNIDSPDMLEIINQYRSLWQIEQTFRISKYNLKIRPIFHYNVERIKSHFAICYIALVLIRSLEFLTKQAGCYLPLEQVCTLLKKVRLATLSTQGKIYSIAEDFPKELLPLYKTIKLKPLNRLTSF